MSEFCIDTKALSCHFGDTRAVEDLTLRVPAGTIFGFLGPNGAGKTTTIRLLLGLLSPSSGDADVLGFDVRTQAQDIRQRCGALLEYAGLYERLSAENNLDFYGRIWRIPKPERRDRINELLTHLNLWDRRREIVAQWSRGMRQKLAVARCFLHRPRLLLLDEPTTGLDPVAAAALREDLAALCGREGVTVFLNTHNLVEAERLCSQVGVIHNGKLLACGPLATLRQAGAPARLEIRGRGFTPAVLKSLSSRPEVASVELNQERLLVGWRGQAQTASLIRQLVEQGVEIEGVQEGSATLEEVFLQLLEEEE